MFKKPSVPNGTYMTIRNILLLPALLGISLGIARAGVPTLDVELRLLTQDALEVSYTLPPSCASLPFLMHGRDGKVVRQNWQARDGCGTAGADQLARTDQACPVLRFEVPASTVRAGYPSAFPMGQGMYVHLSNYAVGDACGKVNYRLAAPWVAAEGRSRQDGMQLMDGGDASALLLTVPPTGQIAGAPAYFDPRLVPAVADRIRQVADGTTGYLRRALPHARFTAPIVAAARVPDRGGPHFEGDAHDVLRLALYNWPGKPSPEDQAALTRFVAHEFSHRFQLRDAVDVYPDARLIHEGGAEFLRWLTSVQKGWMTPREAAADLDQALATCMLGADGQRWRALPARTIGANRLEYACGLPVYVYVLAARQRPGSALARIDAFYEAIRQGAQPDFARALDCGAAAATCTSTWTARLLDGAAPMEQEWDAMLRATGLAHPAPPTQALRDTMVERALVKLMRDDCGGRVDSMQQADGLLLGGMKACKTFTKDAYVTAVEGLPMRGNAYTGAAMAAACTAHGKLVLGLKDGATLDVPCTEPYRMRSSFYQVDIDSVLQALMRN
jgi:hypothetical protein